MRLTRLLKKFNSSKDGPAVATSTPQPEAPCAPQVRPFGLEVLVEGTDPVVDIVAVHGLNGHREHTWTASGGKHWLRDFLPTDLPNARVLCWGYDANTHSNSGVSIQYLYDHARELVTDLTIKRGLTKSRERPIIFVAHSLGGIVVKSALIHSDAAREDALVEHRAIKTSTHGILFMGTPHQGGNGVQLGRVLVNVASIFVSADDHLLKHLERDSEWLQQQLGQFGPISREFVTKFAYEGYPTSSPLGKIMVVPRASAVVPGQPDGEPIVIHADHINMVKFASREDPSYEKVSGMLQIMVENAPIDIRSRWELEKRGAQARHSGRHLQRVSDADSAVYCHEQEHDPKYENDRRNTCLQAFKTSNYEKFKNNNRERVPGTCKWVLEHLKYRKWRESSQDDLLWISADPGCGKSVLAKSLVDEELQRTEEHTVCYFFFKDNDEQNDLSTALCAVLHQLFCSKPLLLPHALDPYEKIGERLQIEAEEMWRILLAATADEHANAVTCVLDALDECRKDDQRHLVKLLTTFYTRAETESTRRSRLKILVTSRPYRDIEHGFKDIPSTLPSIRLAGEKNTAKMTEEINLFVKQEVSKAGRILQLDQEMQRTLQKKLLATSHRTYLWLHLVMRELYLSDKTTKKGLMAVIEKLPKTVTEAYEDVLRRLNNNQRQKAQTILHIVVGARRPLTLQEMDVAIQLATDSADSREHNELDLDLDRLEERIRQLCGLFVYVDNSRVYLIHQTAKEFLLGNEQQASSSYSSWQHSLNERYSNTMLTRICTQYLFFRDFDNHGVDPVRRAQRGSEDHPFLNYAAVHWPSHFSHAEIDQDILMSRLVDLYNDRTPRFATWSSIYWRAVNRGQEIPGLKGIHLLAFNGHNQLLSRFLGLNHEGVDIRAENGSTALAFASRNGHMEMVRLLLEKGADMNAVDNEGQTPMYVASYYGHLDVLQHLIKRGADKDIPNKDSWTPLYTASRNGHLEVVRLLVQNGADLIAAANTGRTPLYETAHHGYLKVFQLLLESGASAHSADKVGWTPLHGASRNGHLGVIQELLKMVRPNTISNEGWTPLLAASERGHQKVVRLLLDDGADPNIAKEDGWTPLYTASRSGHLEVARLLLEKGANAAKAANNGRTPLYETAHHGHVDIFHLLLEKGAVVNTADENGWTLLHGSSSNGHLAMVNLLLGNGANLDSTTNDGWTSLHVASSNGYLEVARLLLEKGADPNQTAKNRGTSLHLISQNGHLNIARLLLEKGADPNLTTNDGRTSLHFVSPNGHLNVARLLLEKGADPNLTTNDGRTSLYIALQQGHLKVARLLLKKGADPNIANKDSWTLLYLASHSRHLKVARLLLKKEADPNSITNNR